MLKDRAIMSMYLHVEQFSLLHRRILQSAAMKALISEVGVVLLLSEWGIRMLRHSLARACHLAVPILPSLVHGIERRYFECFG